MGFWGFGVRQMDFEQPNLERFPCLRLAYQAIRAGGIMPTVLNAANEIAVAAFLERRIGFLAIAEIVADVLGRYAPARPETLDDVFAIDAEARRLATETVEAITA